LVLVHAFAPGLAIDCPKCEAPTLLAGELLICYACGMSFKREGDIVSRPFGSHSWPDSSCGVLVPYEKSKPHGWWSSVKPEDL